MNTKALWQGVQALITVLATLAYIGLHWKRGRMGLSECYSYIVIIVMKFVFFDLEDSSRFFIEYELPKGSTLNATSKKIKEVESILSKLPKDEVKSFVTVIGEYKSEAANYGDSILQGNYFANTILHLTPREKRNRTDPADTLCQSFPKLF